METTNLEIRDKQMSLEHYFRSCKQQRPTLTNCLAEQFSKTLISIRFNLLQFWPSVASVVSVVLL